jgi:biotin transport system substrate-specific component
MVRIALFTAFTATGAYVMLPLPFTPVPFTLQLLFTLLSGLVLGPRDGALSHLVYLALGIAGVPVFAGGNAGPGVLLGPTGGYLVGFVLAAYVVGYLSNYLSDRAWSSLWRSVAIGSTGLGLIHGLGAWWLASTLQIGFSEALALGSIPYIIPDAIKCVGALVAAESLQRVASHRGREVRRDISFRRGAN